MTGAGTWPTLLGIPVAVGADGLPRHGDGSAA